MTILDQNMIVFGDEKKQDIANEISNQKTRKLTQKEFIEKVKLTNNSLVVVGTYVNNKTKVKCRCEKCGFEFDIFPASLYRGTKCVKCSGLYRRTQDDFIKELKETHPNITLTGTYQSMQVSTTFLCKVCEKEFASLPKLILARKQCPCCENPNRDTKQAKNNHNQRRESYEKLKNEIEEILPNVELIGSYDGWNKKIECHCKQCGNIFYGIPGNLRKGEGCPSCGRKKLADKNRKSHEQFVSEVQTANNMIRIVGKYQGDDKKIECECIRCKHLWKSLPTNIRKGHGCPRCAWNQTSFMERVIFLAIEKVVGKDNVVARDHDQIGEELDVYIKPLNTAIEPGSWLWHRPRVTKDTTRYNLCKQKGIRLIIIFDSFDGDRSSLEFDNEDLWTYPFNLGDRNRRPELIDCIKRIFKELELDYNFSEEEELALLTEAKLSVSRRNTSDVVKELAEINQNIELISDYEDEKTKMQCKCKVCGNLWTVDYDHLIRRKQGCPQCNSSNKPLVNLDTGEVFQSTVEAGKKLGLAHTAIGHACRGVTKTCNKHHWAYIQDLTSEQLADLRTHFPNAFAEKM